MEVDMADQEALKDYEELKARVGYAANPDCSVCRGAGFSHPRLEDGKVDYSAIVGCKAKGCIEEQRLAYQATEAYAKEKGVSSFHTFADFKMVLGVEATLAAFKDVATNANAPTFLFVYGTTGNGKTHLCEATVIALLRRGIDCRLWTVPDLVSKLHLSISEHTTEQLMGSLKVLPALIMDEWGQNYGSDWEVQKLEEIIIARERVGLITIITSNLEPLAPGEKEEERGQMRERLVSRFRDAIEARMILNSAADYRPEKKKEVDDGR